MSSANAGPPPVRGAADILEANRRFYDPLWSAARLVEPHRFNTWPLVCSLAAPSKPRLEVAPGLRPRLPLEGTRFTDCSWPAVAKLRARGANAVIGLIDALPYPDGVFDLVCALDVVEHVDDEERALSELSRVASPGGTVIISVPLHPALWTLFDDLVGHRRRFEPARLVVQLARHGLMVERSAVFGMKPKSQRLVDVGMWFLAHRREHAMWWYNHVFMPLGARFQRKLVLVPGMIDTDHVSEALLVCRKSRVGA